MLEIFQRTQSFIRPNLLGETLKQKGITGVPPHFCVMSFWGHFLRENVNLIYFVRDVVIESLVVIRYRVYFCT